MKKNKKYINQPNIFVDADGVLVDFLGAWGELLGVQGWAKIKHIPKEIRDKHLEQMGDRPNFVRNFFANLPMLGGGKKILAYLKAKDLTFSILSAPMTDNESESIEGKIESFRLLGLDDRPAIFTKDKFLYATDENGNPNILIDDYAENTTKWTQHGGIAIKHDDETVDSTLRQLDDILHKYRHASE